MNIYFLSCILKKNIRKFFLDLIYKDKKVSIYLPCILYFIETYTQQNKFNFKPKFHTGLGFISFIISKTRQKPESLQNKRKEILHLLRATTHTKTNLQNGDHERQITPKVTLYRHFLRHLLSQYELC